MYKKQVIKIFINHGNYEEREISKQEIHWRDLMQTWLISN